MGRANGGTVVTFAQIGPEIDNGYEMGGSRVYPWDTGLALQPSSQYSDYIGPVAFSPTAPPAGSLPDTIGEYGNAQPSSADVEAAAHPWGRTSPLPWVVLGIGVLYVAHKRDK